MRTAGRTIYGKKKIRKEKKSKRTDLVNRLREEVLIIRQNLESKEREKISFCDEIITITNLMKKYKASEGSVKVVLDSLYREGLVSSGYRGGIWYVRYDSEKQPKPEIKKIRTYD